MTFPETISAAPADDSMRKPRIAIMGEFSSGKSTLANLLTDSNPLPVKVTATQLPPVWMAQGDQDPFWEDLEGTTHPVDLERLEDIPLHDTAVIRIFLHADLLGMCDIIDMPGISDPNMPPEIWERVIPNADAVLWCTHATQAWRQSEAAVWKSLPQTLIDKSFLLITRMDKLLNARDRQKVLKRVNRETEGLFAGIFPISLTQAMAAQDDAAQWVASGAEVFNRCLIELLEEISGTLGGSKRRTMRPLIESQSADAHAKIFQLEDAVHPEKTAARITPTRVRPLAPSGRTSLRPLRPAQPSV